MGYHLLTDKTAMENVRYFRSLPSRLILSCAGVVSARYHAHRVRQLRRQWTTARLQARVVSLRHRTRRQRLLLDRLEHVSLLVVMVTCSRDIHCHCDVIGTYGITVLSAQRRQSVAT